MSFDFMPYRHLTHFIAAMMGEYTEVVLYSFENMEHSVIEVANGGISGVQIGDPLSGFAIAAMKDKGKDGPPYYLHHKAKSKEGRPLGAHSFIILDRHKNPMGMLSVYSNVEIYTKMAAYFERLARVEATLNVVQETINEKPLIQTHELSPEGVIQQAISEVTKGEFVASKRLSTHEKISVVSKLNQEGFFLIKGAVNQVSKVLAVSEATVYRYLSNLTK